MFPVDVEHPLDEAAAALREAVAGGSWASFEAEPPPVALAAGLALRARLPRGGWEDFAPAPVRSGSGRLLAARLRAAGEGRCTLRVRLEDASGRTLPVREGRVGVRVGASELVAARLAPDASARTLIVVVDPLPAPGGGLPALLAAAGGALEELGAGDLAAVLPSGTSLGTPPTLLPRGDALRAMRGLRWPARRAPRDLLADLDELRRRLPFAATARPLGLLVLSGPVRPVEAVGAASPRFRRLLADWRRAGGAVLWATVGPGGRGERAATELLRAGASRAVVETADALAPAARALVRGFSSARRVELPCPAGPGPLGKELRVLGVVGGRAVESLPEAR